MGRRHYLRDHVSERQSLRQDLQLRLIRQAFPDGPGMILDLGTEWGLTGRSLRAAYPKAKIVGVEIHDQTLKECLEDSPGVYTCTHRASAQEFLGADMFRWDVIVAAEIIEHMTRADGEELLRHLPLRSQLAIVTTPLGFAAQGTLANNPYQRHISGWDPDDFTRLGWKTYAVVPHGLTMGVYFHDNTGRL